MASAQSLALSPAGVQWRPTAGSLLCPLFFIGVSPLLRVKSKEADGPSADWLFIGNWRSTHRKECPWHWERGTYLPWNCNHILKNKPGRQLANHSLPPNPCCFSIPLRAGGYNKVRRGDFGQESHSKPARTGSGGSFSCVWSAYRSPLKVTSLYHYKAEE